MRSAISCGQASRQDVFCRPGVFLRLSTHKTHFFSTFFWILFSGIVFFKGVAFVGEVLMKYLSQIVAYFDDKGIYTILISFIIH